MIQVLKAKSQEASGMFSSRARACYPESSRTDGCFPDNDTTPSRFKCWVDGSPDDPSLFDLADALGARTGRRRRGPPPAAAVPAAASAVNRRAS